MKISTLATVAAVAIVGSAYAAALKSGLGSGEKVTPFHPKHVVGALADTEKCFPCTFQNRPQAQIWVNGDSMTNVVALAKALNGAQETYKANEFKALVVFLVPTAEQGKWTTKLKEAAKKEGLTNVSMALLDPADKAVAKYKINTSAEVKNTVVFYRNWEVTSNWVNVKADAAGLKGVARALNQVNEK